MMHTNLGRRSAQTLLAVLFSIALAACSTTKPVSIDAISAAKADFSPYQTYYVLDVPPGENEIAPPKPFSRVVVEAAVRKELDARNYQEITDKEAADLLVAIQFSLKDEIRYEERTTYDTQVTHHRGYGHGYGGGYGRRGYGRGRGYGGGGYGGGYSYGYGYSDHYGYTTIPRSTVVTEDFRQGNMVIDLIDPKTNSVVWEAHARGEGEHEAAKIEARVNMVVSRIFQRYPHVATTTDETP